jgi:adenosylhomocysteine nucleosidase
VSRLGAVVGLPIERAILRARSAAFDRPSGRWIANAGADARRAEALAHQLVDQGATALLSFGIAAGLDPTAEPGQIVLATEIVLPDGFRVPADRVWRSRLAAALSGLRYVEAPIAGTDRMLATVDQKSDLLRRTRAAAADMESHGVARAAARRLVPCLAIRAVADPASRGLPRSAMAGLAADGSLRPGAAAKGLIRAPGELSALLQLSVHFASALAALWRVAGKADGRLAP